MRRRLAGEGSIYQRSSDGRWVASLSTGPRGSRVVVRRYAKSKADARRALEELLSPTPEPTMELVGAYLERWVNDTRGIRPTTRHGYKAVVTTHLVPAFGHIPLGLLTPSHVESWLSDLEGRMRPKTARNAHAVLRRALGQAVRSELIPRNVAGREFVDAPRVPIEEPRSLSSETADRFLAAIRGDRLAAVFVVAVDAGLRQGELLGLAWDNIHADHLEVRQELIYTKGPKRGQGTYKPGRLKTDRSRRDVPLSDRAKAALDTHRDAMRAEGFVTIGTGPVFVTRRGEAISGSWLTHHFYRLLEAAGIPRLPFKNLRTTFSSRLAERGVPEWAIADLMGHSRTHTTRKHYISPSPESLVAAIRKLAS